MISVSKHVRDVALAQTRCTPVEDGVVHPGKLSSNKIGMSFYSVWTRKAEAANFD